MKKKVQDQNTEETSQETVANTSEATQEEQDQSTEAQEAEANPEGTEKEPEEELSEEEQLRFKLSEINDKYLRLYSEFENYRRRTSKEKLDLMKTAHEDMVVALLPVLDDFDRALDSMKDAQDITAVKEGIELVSNKFKSTLQQKGLKEIDATGKSFDLDYHEAITKIPAPDKNMKGKVVDAIEKGYTLNDKVIRYAKVVVGE